jgi:hypothetical protein
MSSRIPFEIVEKIVDILAKDDKDISSVNVKAQSLV